MSTGRENVSVRRSTLHGTGVFANREFARGEVVLEIDDSDPVPDRKKLSPKQQIHIDIFIGDDETERVVFMKSPEKYVNHSCDPNVNIQTEMATGVRRARASRVICKGEEITWDYELNSWEKWEIPTRCRCGSKTCRRVIQGVYFALPRDVQIRNLQLLDEPFRRKFATRLARL